MKGTLTVVSVVVCCFLLGIGASTLVGTTAKAELSRCSAACGYKIVCGYHPSCQPGIETMHYRCKQWAPALADCSGQWTCGCVALGCGGFCNDL